MVIKDAFRKRISKPNLDYYKIAFRIYLTGKACKMFELDSKIK